MAGRIFGDLRERTVLIFGAGQMAELTARYLHSQKVRSVWVANRTLEHAQQLAQQFQGRALSLEEGLQEMAHADILICSMSSPEPVITCEQIHQVMNVRRGRSLFVIDTALPRNVDPAVHAIDNVYLYNLDDLQKIVQEHERQRSKDLLFAEEIVQEETHEFSRWLDAHRAGTFHGLRHSAKIIRPPETLL
jgi:glutamyl-tRNA reductase